MKRINNGLKILVSIIVSAALIFVPDKITAAAGNNNVIIVLDPGHGGRETGAVNSGLNLVQSELNLKVAKYIAAELSGYSGVEVYLTHYGLASNEALSLVSRVNIAKLYKADMLVSLHFNASTSGREGAEMFVTYKDKYYQSTKRLGDLFLKKLAALGIDDTGVKIRKSESNAKYPDGTIADYYGIIRNAYLNDIPTVLVEHCFIDSADARFVDTEEEVRAVAMADAEAIIEYYSLIKHNELFNDTTNHWAKSTIYKWAELGFVSGYNNKYYPNNSITRAEFVTIINNIMRFEPASDNPFADINDNDWYKDAVLAAYDKGIITGYNDGKFHPNDKITREQACVILHRLFGYESSDMTVIDRFADNSKISDWAIEGVTSMVEKGVLRGTGENELLPGANSTRAEAVILLDRIMYE